MCTFGSFQICWDLCACIHLLRYIFLCYEEAPLVLNLLDGGPPPELDLDSGKTMRYEWMNLPMFKRLLREEDVNGYAGDPVEMPRFVPIDFLLVPQRAENFEDCLTALRWCDKLCTKCETQQASVKHWTFLKVALCEHVFTKVTTVNVLFYSFVPRLETKSGPHSCCATLTNILHVCYYFAKKRHFSIFLKKVIFFFTFLGNFRKKVKSMQKKKVNQSVLRAHLSGFVNLISLCFQNWSL